MFRLKKRLMPLAECYIAKSWHIIPMVGGGIQCMTLLASIEILTVQILIYKISLYKQWIIWRCTTEGLKIFVSSTRITSKRFCTWRKRRWSFFRPYITDQFVGIYRHTYHYDCLIRELHIPSLLSWSTPSLLLPSLRCSTCPSYKPKKQLTIAVRLL